MVQKVTRIETDQVMTNIEISFAIAREFFFNLHNSPTKGNEISILIGQYIDLINRCQESQSNENATKLVVTKQRHDDDDDAAAPRTATCFL